MDGKSDNNLREFITWLENQHADIMGCEAEAIQCLNNHDKAGYSSKMRDKATKLRELDRLSRPLLNGLPESARWKIEDDLGRFSSGASTALKLDSVFYMSALLYPDDHKKGDPDNLQKLIEELKSM